MENVTIVDALIEDIKTDQELLETTEANIKELKDEKNLIVERLRENYKDVNVLMKYADDEHREKVEALGFSLSEYDRGLNDVASIALSLVTKAKDKKLTNDALYNAYVKTLKNKEDAVNYTQFNIKCRTLFNSQKLYRQRSKDAKSSREDIISLKGIEIPKEEK
mgnify:CR=1 FL=1|tara:strand:- start:15882 stop:16373 length:492 start_codon:yes stop_codon:yes gene_type:complete